jgi:hypothetical protein
MFGHCKDGTIPILPKSQTPSKVRTDHTYNIRGWLTDALSVYKKTTNDPDFSVFGYGLTYADGANY